MKWGGRAVKFWWAYHLLSIILYCIYWHATVICVLCIDCVVVLTFASSSLCTHLAICRWLYFLPFLCWYFSLHSQYSLSLLMFLFKNKHQFPVNTEVHHHATRQQSNFHQPPAYLTKYQKGICYLGIKVFNKLPPYIKDDFENMREFKWRLKNFLHEKSYSLQVYFDLRN